MRFSLTEAGHLVGAVTLVTLAFALARASLDHPDLFERPFHPEYLMPDPWTLLGLFLAVASGFVLHELAHKLVAQHYGHWAEFRAWFGLLLLTLPLSLVGFPFAAPGAVLIRGRVSRPQNGVISLAGPATNLAVALAAWPFAIAVDASAPLPHVMGIVAFVNATLGWFNLLPLAFLGNTMDGRKVWRWSKTAYFLALAGNVGAWIGILTTTGVLNG